MGIKNKRYLEENWVPKDPEMSNVHGNSTRPCSQLHGRCSPPAHLRAGMKNLSDTAIQSSELMDLSFLAGHFMKCRIIWWRLKKKKKKHCCCCSIVKLCPTLCDPMDCSMPGFPVLHYLPEFAQTHVHFIQLMMPFNHLILPSPLLLLPSILPSIRVFSEESVLCISWPKYRCYRKAIFYCFLL